jgi:hypothetical protein
MYEHYIGISIGLIGTVLITSKSNKIRKYGFMTYALSNLAWSVYWISVGDYIPLIQYVVFTVMNVRGIMNNR